jgi:hypothetical protein
MRGKPELTVVCQLWAMTFLQLPPGSFEKTRAAWLGGARQQTFAGADAATSDLFSAELEVALVGRFNQIERI